jgi:hypothetical protein
MENASAKKDTRIALANQRVGDTDNSARDGLGFGRTLKELLYSGLIERLTRYETNLQRQLTQTIKESHEKQSARLSRSNDAATVDFKSEPEIVDVAQNETSQPIA